MKPALPVCFVLGLAVGLGCSIDRRSDTFACVKNSDCNSGRQCVDGFCVVEGNQPIDAAPGSGSGNTCPASCTSCSTNTAGQKTCDINCEQSDCSQGGITCPAGFACTVECNGNNDCRNGVSCGSALSCTVTCSNDQTCNKVTCGSGACNVTCSGKNSCQTVDCGNACACDVTCSGQQSCLDVTCGHDDACPDGANGCSSTLDLFCNTCQQ